MFFEGWETILRVLITGTLGYIGLIIILRVAGKRTLAKMNMFDFVVTIALGSLFATLILSDSVSLAEGMTSIVLLVGLQFVVAWLSVRSKRFQKLVKGSPRLLFYRGNYLDAEMKRTRVAKEEIRFAVRAQGMSAMDEVGAVIMETNGDFSVIPSLERDDGALEDVSLPEGGQSY